MLTKVLICLVAAVLFIAAAVLLFLWVRKKEASARNIAAQRTEAEVDIEHQQVVEIEAGRSDQEALEKWNANFGEQP